MYRIYYTQEGEITTVGVSDQPGDYIECDLETMMDVQKNVHLYEINMKIQECHSLRPTRDASSTRGPYSNHPAVSRIGHMRWYSSRR